MAKKKKINPNRVTHTMKQLYVSQGNSIRKKIARRLEWAEEWSKKIEQIENEIKTVEIAEGQAIADLKLQLETTQIIQAETSSTICLVEDEIKENHLKYKHEIAQLQIEKIQGVQEKTAKASILDQKEQEIRFFMADQKRLYEGLKQRQENMVSTKYKQKEKLAQIQQSRVHRKNRITKEIEQKLHIFAEGFRNSIKMDDPIFDENAHLKELNLYISSQIRDLSLKIGEKRKQIKELRGKKFDQKFKSSLVKKEVKVLEEKRDFKKKEHLTISVQTDSEEFNIATDPVDEVSENRIKAILKSIKKLINEAQALFLIPQGCLPEEAKFSDEEVHSRYKNRRDFIINRRQYIFELILQVIQHG